MHFTKQCPVCHRERLCAVTAAIAHSDRNTFISANPLVPVTSGPGMQAQLFLLSQMWQLQHVLGELEEGWEISGLFAHKEDVDAQTCLSPFFVTDSRSKNTDEIRPVLHKVLPKQLRSHLAQLPRSLCLSRGAQMSALRWRTFLAGTRGSTTVQGRATEETKQPLLPLQSSRYLRAPH